MEYEYDYDPAEKEESNPNVVPAGASYYYEQNAGQMDYDSVTNEAIQEADDNKKANGLCMLSVASGLVPDFLLGFLGVVGMINTDNPGLLGGLLSMLSGVGHIASLVLMIYVRVKYPKNVFGKVLMWLYVIGIVLTIVGVILVMAFFFWFCHELESSGCSGMVYVLPALLGGM